MNDTYPDLMKTLPEDHLLYLLYSEHQVIKSNLDELEKASRRLAQFNNYPEALAEIEKLRKLTRNLLAAEPHHLREEDVLFPEMEKLGITGPPSVMRTEHVGLREYKEKLSDILNRDEPEDFSDMKGRVIYLATGIIGFLRQHIYKEDFVLYPMAYRAVKDAELWEEMKKKSDNIGPCPFE